MTATGLLDGSTILVTGALGGLGSSIVDQLVSAGAHLALHHLGQGDQATNRVAELRERGATACAVEADVTDWDQVERMVATVESSMGSIDVLVNNAGVMAPATFAEMTLDQWRQTIDVDLTGVFVCARHVVPGMLRRGRGVIINMSSQLAFKGARDYASYCAAKAGVVGLTRAMSRELGPTIRVNAVAPGPVDTPMVSPYATNAFIEERTHDLVIHRLAQPDEIAPTVVFLASPGAELLHGQTLHVNGGGVMA